MSVSALSDGLLAKLAGWEVLKQARSMMAAERVLASEWQPPMLRGSVREGASSLRAGLVIHSDTDAENLCPCRDSRQRGIICAHSVAVGLHYLKGQSAAAAPSQLAAKTQLNPAPKTQAKALLRSATEGKGEPLEICLILPPNFPEALSRGKVMLYLEGRRGERRLPLNAFPLNTPFALDAQDSLLLDALESLNGGDTPAMLMLTPPQFAEVLPKLVGHSRLTLGKTQALHVVTETARPRIGATLEANGEIVLRLNANPSAAPRSLIRGTTTWAFNPPDTVQPLGLPPALHGLLEGPLRIPRSRVPNFLNLEWPAVLTNCEVEADIGLDDFVIEPATPVFKLHLAGGLAMLQAKLSCVYQDAGGRAWIFSLVSSAPVGNAKATWKPASGDEPAQGLSAPDSPWLPDAQSPTHYRTRNFSAEQAAFERLLRCGFTGPDAQGLLHLKGQNPVLSFFAREYPKLQKEWEVTLEERLEHSTEKNLERIEGRFEITPSGEQWFDLHMSYDTRGGDRFDAADIQRLLLSGQSHTRLKNGKFALLDTGAVEELQEVLVDCAAAQQGGAYRLPQAQAGFLEATLRGHPGWHLRAPVDWTQQAAQQRGEIKLEPPPLGALEDVLRPYQKEGVAWLSFLRAHGFGGILADEMGLGKTVQVLALLDSLNSGDRVAPHLVVCPTSLVLNWAAEAAKFTPKLRALVLQGPGRNELLAAIPEHDLVITSYALLRRDADHYSSLEFDTVVLDEAQHIKNRQTQNAIAVKALRTHNRLVLTGTPLENSVLDLWSIFDFLMPGYLGSARDFRERYELPLARDRDAAVQARLARRLRPFMLRRLKRDVAADLPEKIEQVAYCELTEGQRALYQQVLEASRHEILEASDASGSAKSRMLVLTALLRLRQICCDPRLLEASLSRKQDEAGASPLAGEPLTSGKTEMFGELLEEVLDGAHRVLVFSQFTSMLALLRAQLSAREIPFCYLDGATVGRAQVVDKFQRDSRIPVFLISLKAGGVGLNLSGADTVIHFDPWWNPAVEAQATDRAHRIGQKNVVTSYKLITRGTVEEKILNLQNRKRALLQGLLGDEEQFVQSLSWEEIRELIS